MATAFSPAAWLAKGREFFARGEFENALVEFTNGIKASNEQKVPASAQLLDCRAATHCRLGNYRAAIQDGRMTIRLYKTDVRGYSRTAKALAASGDLSKAENICRYGMKCVEKGRDREHLEQHLNKLTKALGNFFEDPLARLPPEIISMVFKFVPFKTMVNCLRVSRGWNKHFHGDPAYWTHLDLSGATREVHRNFVRNAIFYSRGRLSHVTYHRFSNQNLVRSISNGCKQLAVLEIISFPFKFAETIIYAASHAENLKKLIIHNEVSFSTFSSIFRFCTGLEHIELRAIKNNAYDAQWPSEYKNLKTLILLGQHQAFSRLSPHVLVTKTPKLEHLELANWPDYELRGEASKLLYNLPLHTLILNDINITTFPLLPPTLRKLVMRPRSILVAPCCAYPRRGPPLEDLHDTNAEQSYLPHLTFLDISDMADMDSNFLTTLLGANKEAPILEYLRLNLVSFHPAIRGLVSSDTHDGLLNPIVCALLPSRLKALEITNLSCTDDDIENLVTKRSDDRAPLLQPRSVNVSMTNITGAGIKMLADIPGMETIVANHCLKVSSRDAINYAERKGIQVVANWATRDSGGRKIRHE